MPPRSDREKFGLPPRPFLYTLDQIATLMNLSIDTVKTGYVHFDQRSVGARPFDRMMARNIAPLGEKPEWRVAEQEFIRFLKKKGFRTYARGGVSY